jgi:diguanylate cyclase (GGDEF)-like protein
MVDGAVFVTPVARREARGNRRLPRPGDIGVKEGARGTDRPGVSERPLPDRRASSATPSDVRLRALGAVMRVGLVRTLAEDDDRAAYWVRHVRIGVVVNEMSAIAVAAHTLVTDPLGGNVLWILALTALGVVAAPVILLLPLRAMMLDWRGPTLFYVWTCLTAAVVIVGTRLDGGASSPMDALLLLALAHHAVAFPPLGVVLVGTVMTAGYLVFVELPGISTTGGFFLTVMGHFTVVCALASANFWAASERMMLLVRTQEMLAGTDPLTGIPNRRLFMERVSRSVEAAAQGRRAVVLLVDLDRFKAVNDSKGHAAGDALLTAVGAALGAAVRETDTVARLGGDEFGVLIHLSADCPVGRLVDRVREAVSDAGRRYGVTASVGMAEIEPGEDVEVLMHRADIAMYRAKTGGGSAVRALDA